MLKHVPSEPRSTIIKPTQEILMPSFIKLKAVVTSLILLVSIFTLSTVDSAAASSDRSFGDVQILATVPHPPGFPEGIAVNGDKVYVAGPASFDTAGTPASKVFSFDLKTGELLRTYEIQGELTQFPHANSCIAFDNEGRLYVVSATRCRAFGSGKW
jgi:hypothetical protein